MTKQNRDRLVALKKAKKSLIPQRQAAEEISARASVMFSGCWSGCKARATKHCCMGYAGTSPTAGCTTRPSKPDISTSR